MRVTCLDFRETSSRVLLPEFRVPAVLQILSLNVALHVANEECTCMQRPSYAVHGTDAQYCPIHSGTQTWTNMHMLMPLVSSL